MVLRLLSISIFLFSIILPRNIYFKPNFISSSNLEYVQLPEPIKTNYSLLSRFELDTTIIWADDLEDTSDGWQFNDGWNLTSVDSYSGNFSLLSPNDGSTMAQVSESGNYFSLYSSVFSLPAIPSY